MSTMLDRTLHCSNCSFVNQRVLKRGGIGVLVGCSVCLLLNPSLLLLKIAIIAVSALCSIAFSWSRMPQEDLSSHLNRSGPHSERVIATGAPSIEGGGSSPVDPPSVSATAVTVARVSSSDDSTATPPAIQPPSTDRSAFVASAVVTVAAVSGISPAASAVAAASTSVVSEVPVKVDSEAPVELARGPLQCIINISIQKNLELIKYNELKKNCALYYGGISQIPREIEFNDENCGVNLYTSVYLFSATPKNEVIPFRFITGGLAMFFGVLCSFADLREVVSEEETIEKLSRDESAHTIGIEDTRAVTAVAEESFKKELVENITETLISFFTTERSDIELEILSKEGDLAIRFRGKVISIKAYLSSLDSSARQLLNIRSGMIEAYRKKTLLCRNNRFEDAPECDTPAKILGAWALQSYSEVMQYKLMNNLMRGINIGKIPDKELLEAIFHIILLKHRLHTFSKIDFRAPRLRKDANIPLPIVNDLIMAFKKDQIVYTPAFFSTTRLPHCVMGGDRNVIFTITPLLYSKSKGVLIYQRGSKSPHEEEVLFAPGTVFKIIAISKSTFKFRERGGAIRSETTSYTIDLQELPSEEGADKGLGIL